MSVPVTLKGGARGIKIFLRISIITLVSFDLNDRIWQGNTGGDKHISGDQPRTNHKRRVPDVHNILGLLSTPKRLAYSDEICCDNTCGE